MKLVKKLLFVLSTMLVISGCAPKLWVKNNSTKDDFERDRYTCLQQSQQRVGAAQVSAYGGTAINTVETNNLLFSTCMGSKGWSLQDKEVVQVQAAQNQINNQNLKGQFDQLQGTLVAMCNKDALKEYYKKSACKATDISFEQLADDTTITAEQKTVLIKQREEVALLDKEFDQFQRQRGDAGIRLINVQVNYVRPENEKNNLDLYNGKITWGGYNKRRKEIAIEGQNRVR